MRCCTACGKPLTPEEARFYEIRCEGCERDELERWQAWRHGAEDAELSALYDVPPDTTH